MMGVFRFGSLNGASALALLAAGGAVPAMAQDAASGTEASADTASPSTTTRSTFAPEDFARFVPRSALDMARQVPGFTIREGDGARGLGQADTNVLINGRRISGKSNGPVEALQRIPVEDVVRLELVDGASLDIGGLSGQVLNVITRSSGRLSGQFRLNPQFRSFGTPARLFGGNIAVAGGSSKTEWNVALRNEAERRGDLGPERVFDAAGRLIETRQERSNFNTDDIYLSGSLTRTADNGNILNLNGEVSKLFFTERERSEQVSLIGLGNRSRAFRYTDRPHAYEVGGDYQFALGPGRLKLIAFHGLTEGTDLATVRTAFADGRPATESRFGSDYREGETIARGEYTLAAAGGSWVAALEGARNFLASEADLAVLGPDGAFRPVPLPGASARVDEDRVDGGLTYSRQLAPGLQFQLSGGAEFSRISQSGAFGLTRQFWRPKGFVALDWKASGALNVAGRIERVVGQLDFGDFLASVDLDQDRENGSNGRLVPPQSWVSELELNLTMGTLGKVNLRGFYEDITDLVDLIPLDGGGQGIGNIPSATRYGVNGDVTLLSDRLGWKGTRFDLRFAYVGSRVIDPLLGTPRELPAVDRIILRGNLRHDFSDKLWAMGGSFEWQDFSPTVRLDEVFRRSQTFGYTAVFLERKNIAGLTVRGSWGNQLDRRNKFDRTLFADRAAGLVNVVETRRRKFGQIFTVEIEGSF